jgi:hypothetical protein
MRCLPVLMEPTRARYWAGILTPRLNSRSYDYGAPMLSASRAFFFGLNREEKLSRCVSREMRRQTPPHTTYHLRFLASNIADHYGVLVMSQQQEPQYWSSPDPLLGNGPALPHGYSHTYVLRIIRRSVSSTIRRKHACQATGEKNVFQKGIIFGARSGAESVGAAYEGAGVWGQSEDLGGGPVRGLIGRSRVSWCMVFRISWSGVEGFCYGSVWIWKGLLVCQVCK